MATKAQLEHRAKIHGSPSTGAILAERALQIRVVTAGIEAAYDLAVEGFKARPGGDRWEELITVMWGWQYWKGLTQDERENTACTLLYALPPSRWMLKLREAHEPGFKG